MPARSTPRCRATLRRSTKAPRWRRLRLRVRVPPNANDARARAIGRESKRARFSPRRRSAWTIRTSCWKGRLCTSASCLDTRACWATHLRRTTLDLLTLMRMRLIPLSYPCDFEFRSHGHSACWWWWWRIVISRLVNAFLRAYNFVQVIL